MNYRFSKDYELLWELAQKQEVICYYNDSDRPGCTIRKLGITQYDKCNDEIKLPGNWYCDNKEDFERTCKLINFEFLIPGEVEELVEALKNIIDLSGSCTCIDAYKKRNMIAPDCIPCNIEIEKAKELLKKYEDEK